jgi:prepilin-type N-terminal cleavage/methylation domain-containing protein
MSHLVLTRRFFRNGARGFTLIETLIALVVAATAAAVILAQLRGLVARAEQARAHELAVLRLLNESARLSLGSPGGERLEPVDNDSLKIHYRDPAWPVVTVRNFSATGEPVPPLLLAYTPFQLYTVSEAPYVLSLVAPGIRRPDAILPKAEPPAPAAAGAPAPKPRPALTPNFAP